MHSDQRRQSWRRQRLILIFLLILAISNAIRRAFPLSHHAAKDTQRIELPSLKFTKSGNPNKKIEIAFQDLGPQLLKYY